MVQRAPVRVGLLVALAVVALARGLTNHRLLDPDEGRNAEVAREMAATHDFLVPHLDGLPYLDKPIVYFAAAAAAIEALGPTELAVRLPAFLFTLASIVLVGAWARRRWGPDAGGIAALALATMPLVLAFAAETIFDSALAFFVTAGILGLVEDRPVLAWAAIGIGAITKGPVAIAVPLLVLVPWSLTTGRPLRRLVPLRGLAAFAVCALPWFVAVTLRHPDFPHYVFVDETFRRVTTRAFHRAAPWWYYLPIVPVAAFPWFVPAVAGVSRWRWLWGARAVNPAAREAWLLVWWLVGPLIFFSLNESKLPHYVLPLMPALALAAARMLTVRGVGAAWRWSAGALVVLGAALLTLTRWLPAPLSLTPDERAAVPGAAAALGAVLVLAAALLAAAVRWQRRGLALAAYAAGVIALPFAGGRLLGAVGRDRSSAPVTDMVGAVLARDSTAGGARVLGVRAFPLSMAFYLRRTMPLASDSWRELTSNYVAARADSLRARPGSPLLPLDAWRDSLRACSVPTVFVTRAGDRDLRAAIAARIPLLAEDRHYAAYGPCRPAAPAR